MSILKYTNNEILEYSKKTLDYVPPIVVYDYDGNYYEEVKVGNQVWLDRNLRTIHLSDGTPINNITNNDDWYFRGEDLDYAWPNNSILNAYPYGAIYKHECISSGLFVPGYHVPTPAEITALKNELGVIYGGGKLKETGTDHWRTYGEVYNPPVPAGVNVGATNSTGLSYVGTNFREYNGTFFPLGQFGYYWTSVAYIYYRQNAGNAVFVGPANWGNGGVGMAIRLIKD